MTSSTRCVLGRQKADREDRRYASEPRYGRRPVEPGSRLLVEDEDERRVIERCVQLRGEGLSYRTIARRLLEEGHRPRRASRWSAAVVHRIVTGKRAPKKTVMSRRLERARAALLGDAA